MKKAISALTAMVMVFLVLFQPQAQAATAIKIYIDGKVLVTDQAPILEGGYTFVPLRGIFEALNANVQWNPKTKTVTATKRDTTVVLTLGAKTATINNKTVTLDAPARFINGRTLVPVRFVSESLGEEVNWNPKTQSVLITTSAVKGVGAATSVNVASVSQYGDGRDLQIGFTPPSDQSNVNSYRILVVKAANAPSFNLAKAQIVGAINYTVVAKNNANQKTLLSSQARDVDGALIGTNQAYKVYVLTVGKDIYALSNSSATITLSRSSAVDVSTNVKINDVSDFGDGRDLSVSFTKAKTDNNISSYRVMIVKSKDAANFGVTAANSVSSSYYNVVSKTSAGTLSTLFSSSSRDTSGELIKNGVAYTAFVLSLSTNTGTASNSLSTGSSSVTLGTAAGTPVITNVADVNNYGDGRDLQISFNKATDENRISFYRIFVVNAADYGSFTLTEANKVSSGRYYDVSKSSYSYSQVLSSSAKDVKGNTIKNGVAYRIFVMGVTNNSSSYSSVLSTPSASITLATTGVNVATNLSVSDVSDFNNGKDLRVTFTKAVDESNINHYRIFVVKDANAASFNLTSANALSSSTYYTTVSKTGSNINQILPATARDVNGALIQNGVSYRVFVLSVGSGNSSGTNALSSYSSAITLSNIKVAVISNLSFNDVSDYGNGNDLQVTFTRASNESNINHYRILVVKDGLESRMNLETANALHANNYTTVPVTGTDISKKLSSDTRDVNGDLIRTGVSYRVFVLSVGGGNSNGTNALSSVSASLMLSNNSVSAATNVSVNDVSDYNNGQDLQVIFTKAADESNINHYRILIVKDGSASGFNLASANAVTNSNNYTTASITGGNYNQVLSASARDVNGSLIQKGVSYRVFILSVGGGNAIGMNALSLYSSAITLANNSVAAVTNVSASDISDYNNGQDLQVAFTKATDESPINHYRVFVVRDELASSFDLAMANAINIPLHYTIVPATGGNFSQTLSSDARDVNGAPIQNNVGYRVFVLTVAKASTSNALSLPSNSIVLASAPAPVPAPIVQNVTAQQNGLALELMVSFTNPTDQSAISHYAVLLVPATVGTWSEDIANSYYTAGKYTRVEKSTGSAMLTNTSLDVTGAPLAFNVQYQIYVLSLADGTLANVNKLSSSSASVKLNIE
jgi:hypothetical protein